MKNSAIQLADSKHELSSLPPQPLRPHLEVISAPNFTFRPILIGKAPAAIPEEKLATFLSNSAIFLLIAFFVMSNFSSQQKALAAYQFSNPKSIKQAMITKRKILKKRLDAIAKLKIPKNYKSGLGLRMYEKSIDRGIEWVALIPQGLNKKKSPLIGPWESVNPLDKFYEAEVTKPYFFAYHVHNMKPFAYYELEGHSHSRPEKIVSRFSGKTYEIETYKLDSSNAARIKLEDHKGIIVIYPEEGYSAAQFVHSLEL